MTGDAAIASVAAHAEEHRASARRSPNRCIGWSSAVLARTDQVGRDRTPSSLGRTELVHDLDRRPQDQQDHIAIKRAFGTFMGRTWKNISKLGA